MSDGRKRLSGAQYRKQAKEKKKRNETALSETRKLDSFKLSFLPSSTSFEPTTDRCECNCDAVAVVSEGSGPTESASARHEVQQETCAGIIVQQQTSLPDQK
jgi:hypothetical protein